MRVGLLLVLWVLVHHAVAGELPDCGARQNADAEAYQHVIENLNQITASAYESWDRPSPEASPSPTSEDSPEICQVQGLYEPIKRTYCDHRVSVQIGHFTGKHWRLEYGLGVNTNFGDLSVDTPSVILNQWEADRNAFIRFRYQY